MFESAKIVDQEMEFNHIGKSLKDDKPTINIHAINETDEIIT